ncbi:MAG: hypothetical protein RIQ93_1821 [Verrucomicrobiota bacterium]|jgi:hypothetical protein
MKVLLICPSDRPAVARLADTHPLVVLPLCGQSLLEYWIEWLVVRKVTRILVLAADRPHAVRAVVGDGSRWGVHVELVPQSREITSAEARDAYFKEDASHAIDCDQVILLDHLPGHPERPLFESYAGWFAALEAWIPDAVGPGRIGVQQVQPGVWVGLHSEIDPRAQLTAPCWIGANVIVGPDTIIGPAAIVEDRVVIDRGARIVNSAIGPETFVGRFVSVENSCGFGSALLNCRTGSFLRVPDSFLLGPLEIDQFNRRSSGLAARTLALSALLISSPAALIAMAVSLLRCDNPLQLRLGVRPLRHLRDRSPETFAYYELTGAGNWLRRWPQFWSVARGDLAWVGNRPLRPTEAFVLVNDFERLWLVPPPGLVSLADASGCPEGVSAESNAHASFYAVNASWRLDAVILMRALLQAAMVWPIRWNRRRETASALPRLVPKQEG